MDNNYQACHSDQISEDVQEILELYRDPSLTIAEIGELFNISSSLVSRIAKENGISRQGGHGLEKIPFRRLHNCPNTFESLSDTQKAAICNLYKDGVNVSNISQQFGINVKSMYRVIDEHGISRRQPSRANRSPKLNKIQGEVSNHVNDRVVQSSTSSSTDEINDYQKCTHCDMNNVKDGRYCSYCGQMIENPNTLIHSIHTELDSLKYLSSSGTKDCVDKLCALFASLVKFMEGKW